MADLSNDQLEAIVNQIVEDNGSQLTNSELLEVICLIMEDIPGYEIADSQTLTEIINHVRNLYYESNCKNTNRTKS